MKNVNQFRVIELNQEETQLTNGGGITDFVKEHMKGFSPWKAAVFGVFYSGPFFGATAYRIIKG